MGKRQSKNKKSIKRNQPYPHIRDKQMGKSNNTRGNNYVVITIYLYLIAIMSLVNASIIVYLRNSKDKKKDNKNVF